MFSQLDIVGSVIIGGMVTLLFATFMTDKQGSELAANNMVINQISTSSIEDLMMFDLRKMGYRFSGNPLLTAQSKNLRFVGDIDNDGKLDTVRYWFATPVTSTPNPSDSLLYRQVNSQTAVGSSLGLTNLNFQYLDNAGNITTDPAFVRAVNVAITVQSRFPVDGRYQQTAGSFRITPKNKK